MKKVEITWADIIHEHGWHDQDELDQFINEKSMIVRQLGYLYEEDDNYYVVLDSFFEDNSLFGTIHMIPKGCVISLHEVT